MADPRFFREPAALSLARIAGLTGAELADPAHADFLVEDVATLEHAGESHISFLDNAKYRDAFQNTKAGACIVHPDMARIAPPGLRLLISKSPYRSYAQTAQAFYPVPMPETGISDTAQIHGTAKLGKGCVVEAYAVIGEGVEIGDDTWIEAHAVISSGCKIGKGCRIGSHATVAYALIGDYVRIYPGARIGQDGFGFAIDPAGFVKVPQLGRVIIEGHSEIGANTTIDRGALGDTVIGAGTWIDNLVQIAHNVKIGKGCIFAAQAGVSGSTEIGDYVAIGGQAGFAGHLKIGSMARIAAKSGVTRDIPPKGEWMGYPAMPMKQYLRQVATLNRLIAKKKLSNDQE
jgi:UDP-3-O-[3-hydroxymyristoyl] glucosamine N-acyltransferase